MRTPEEMQARQNANSPQQYVISEKPVEEGVVLREVDSPEIVEGIQNQPQAQVQPMVETQTYVSEDISEEQPEEYPLPAQESLVQSSFIDDKGELADADTDSENKEQPQDVSINTQSGSSAAQSENYTNLPQGNSADNVYAAQAQPIQNNPQPEYGYQFASAQNVPQDIPSPLYQSNNYFDENNEVNYVTSFADLFRIEEEKPAEAPPEYDFMSMNEMVFKFQAKGVTIKPYNKKNTMEFYVNRYYYSNKLHFHTALIMFFIMAIELVASHFICNRNDPPISNYWLFSVLIVALYPIIRGVMYAIEPNKKSLANFNPKTTLLISLLPVITLPIVIALLGFVQFGANINDYSSMERTIILPCVLLFNIPFYFFVFALKYRTNKYHIN